MTSLDTQLVAALRTDDYTVTDPAFGAPYVDVDEWRTTLDQAHRYRFVHGGFAGTDTRFACYFPPPEVWRGRMLFPVEGGLGGYENTCETIQGFILDQLGIGFRLGAYVVESNGGHVGVDLDASVGENPSIYGYRAHAESARVSKHLAAQIYGEPPRSSFAYGGGGGGMRAQLCLENTDVFDAAMPYVGVAATMDAATFEVPESERFLRSATFTTFGCVLNVHRLLGPLLAGVIDATEPGGSGDPFAGLDTHQREELASLYRLGFPRGSEVLISEPVGAVSAWAWMADEMVAEDPSYFRSFWTEPGYLGHDAPELAGAVVRATTKVKRVVTAAQLLERAADQPGIGALATFMVGMKGPDFPCAVEVEDPLRGYVTGATVTVGSGAASGRRLYVAGGVGGTWYVDGAGAAGTARLAGVEPGDELVVDNADFLAFCYSHRHHTPSGSAPGVVDGRAVYPQHPLPRASALLGGPASGSFGGKLLLLPATNDSNVWPGTAVALLERIALVGSADRVRIRWMENAENLPGSFIPSGHGPAMTTRFIDYNPIVEQSLHDLAAWVEDGIAPDSTGFGYAGGRLELAPTAVARGGIQAVLRATADGCPRAEVPVGADVELDVAIEVPAGAGQVVGVVWDPEGTGAFDHPVKDGLLRHRYTRPGTYFPCVRVTTHRDGDPTATSRIIPNLARVRVVVA